MVKLKTDKAELNKAGEAYDYAYENDTEGNWDKFDEALDTTDDELVKDLIDDALAAHEMKPEYDRMKFTLCQTAYLQG